ncbi:Myb-like DNA-binding domain containing protein [Ectocarpus siliculosus]|uniref:Myb-like DNA-binding domain containing protein n=1 Tax=Ectocarpus siliculosus TaxID=2880 RepID=D7FN70_ECTSI|nr:Myb-like DNA-binding domain containing protein [Ectocarpus siliculosus]|eukprot:CBJ30131.1 Myb-like DNA-binding domain containing protein [Ectocarpus siliculosus]
MNPLPNRDTPSSPSPTNSNDVAPASDEEDGDLFGSAEDLSLPSVGGEDFPPWALGLDLTADIEALKARERETNEACKPAASKTSGTGARSTGHASSQDSKPVSMQQRNSGRFSSVEDIELGRAVAHYTGELKGQVWKKIALSLPGRSARQCRDRWFNYLDTNLKMTPWSTQEFRLLHLAQAALGRNQWAKIKNILPQRSSVGITTASKSTEMQEWRKTFDETSADPETLRLFHERMETSSLSNKNRSIPSKETFVPPSDSGGGTSAKDDGAMFSGSLEGLSSTRDSLSSQKRVVLVVWTKEEDARLTHLVITNGEGSWDQKAADLSGALLESRQRREAEGQASGRPGVFTPKTGRQCSERWTTHLVARVQKNPWTKSEDETLRQAVRISSANKEVSAYEVWRVVAKTVAFRTGWECQHRWRSIQDVAWTNREWESLSQAQGKRADRSSSPDRFKKERRSR